MIELDCGESFVKDFLNPEMKKVQLPIEMKDKPSAAMKTKSKRELVFEEMNHMVAAAKRLEFQIKK
jgi:hypothetical protein